MNRGDAVKARKQTGKAQRPQIRSANAPRGAGRTKQAGTGRRADTEPGGSVGGRKAARPRAVRAAGELSTGRGRPQQDGKAPPARRRRGAKKKLRMQVQCKVTVRDENGSRVSKVETAVGERQVPTSWSLERRWEALGARLRRNVRVDLVAQMMGVLGSGHRLRILGTLAGGAATYRGLVKTTGLSAGPLYHHVNQLRLAGLVRPKERDLYEITPKGMRCLLMAAAMGRMR